MAVAKERVPLQEIVDRIPHPKIAYAYLEVKVQGTVEEFLAFRSEALKKHPLYAESPIAKQPPGPTPEAPAVVDALEQAEAMQEDVDAAVTEAPAAPVAPPAASAPTEGLSARDKARALLLAKKGAS